MSNKPVVVIGEASETDSDDETLFHSIRIEPVPSFQASVIQGEDSESDQDIDQIKHQSQKKTYILNEEYSDSLLHKKLRESNLKLHAKANSFAEAILQDSEKTLATVELELMKCQLTMQSAVSALQTLTSNSNKIRCKLDHIMASSFLSNIKM